MNTRRQFLSLIASLLTLIDAVRRFFSPPDVAAIRRITSKSDAENLYGLKPRSLDLP